MKKHLALSLLLTTTHLLADGCCDSCGSCCEPQPKKCIDCVCYTPAFYDLQCDAGLFVSGDFLYWYARETHLPYAIESHGMRGIGQLPFDVTTDLPVKVHNLKTNWKPGFRIGAGFYSSCDGWDFTAYWTSFKNKRKDSTSVPADFNFEGDPRMPGDGQNALVTPWVDTAINSGVVFSFDDVRAKWTLHFNQLDVEVGRKYWLSRCFTMRPYAGVRGGWIKTVFDVFAKRNAVKDIGGGIILANPSFDDRFVTKSWGAGLLVGFEPTWYLTRCFALFGNLDGSLIWGKLKSKKTENYNTSLFGLLENKWNNASTNMTAILDLALGIRFEDTWCCDRFRTALDLGWEHHIWFNADLHTQTTSSFNNSSGGAVLIGFANINEVRSDLVFGGFVARLRIDF